MSLHKVLQRQLNRFGLNEDTLPNDIEQWQEFINKINNAYNDNDEERYLTVRSMELSSREINELNERFQNAQQVAGISYWHYDTVNDVITWSQDLKKILNIAMEETVPNYKGVLEMVHPDDRDLLDSTISNTIKTGKKYELNIRMQPRGGDKYIWLHVIGAPYHCKTAPFTQLSGICMDITKRKEAEQEIEVLHQEILESARRIGMADVAVSILHNVGNVLNSANVSISLLNEGRKQPYIKRFLDICKMLQDHAANINDYFINDEKGKLIPSYLTQLTAAMSHAYENEEKELLNLTEKIQHIRDIVAAQQSLSQTGKITESISPSETMDSALKMVGTQLSERGVKVKKEYEHTENVTVDRAKLLQILVNFIQNAKDALIYDPDESKSKLVTLKIKNATPTNQNIEFIVQDTGIGISQENLKKIFTYGFTTKETGHGIGMHSSLLAAKDIGANIIIESKGEGLGAMLTLQVPVGEKKHGQ